MNTITETERTGLLSLTQELQDAKNTSAAISQSFASPAKEYDDSNKPNLASRLSAILDPRAASAAAQLGPWDTGYITFGGGVPVGGYSNLTLFQNGAYNFSGHYHVSGAPSYNTSFVWAVSTCTAPATVYAFAHTGRVHGTFEAGSRDDDWGRSEILPALAEGWNTLAGCYRWRWDARVNIDLGVFLDDIIKLVAAGQALGNVIKVFV